MYRFAKLNLRSIGCILFSSLLMTGCSTFSKLTNDIDDGSLDYQKAKLLPPLQIPVEQPTAPFTPLYPTPSVGVNTLDLTNDTGKHYQLPAPYRNNVTSPR